jgi:uncharacterized membrane protein YfcA
MYSFTPPKMTTQLILLVILLGLVAGILSGLVGIGGGIVLVPALVYFLQYNQHQAQGTSLGVLTFPVVILGFLKYYADSKGTQAPIDFKVVGLLALGFVVGGYLGSTLALKIDKELLRKIFGLLLLYTAFKMLHWDTWVVGQLKKIF